MDSRARLDALTRSLRQHLQLVPEGHVLSSSFLLDLEHPLGAGGQGAVYPGLHAQLELPVAIKIFGADETGNDDKLLARFVGEARMLALINSPYVVRVWDLSRIPELDYYYFVTEFVAGAALQDCVANLSRHLTEAEALSITLACARGLAAMHDAGIIHRDFKPGNALWVGGTNLVKVCDLGLAKECREDAMSLTNLGETFGSPAYMAPEQARGAKDVTPRADVYSLGAVLHYLLTGEPPVTSSSLQTMIQSSGAQRNQLIEATLDARGVSLRTKSLVVQMLSKRPEDRPEDGAAAIELLGEVLDDVASGVAVSLTEAFHDAPRTRPMRVELPKADGVLWMPPARADAHLESLSDTMVGGIVRRASTGDGAKKEPSLETQFWESAFPILKKDREKGG